MTLGRTWRLCPPFLIPTSLCSFNEMERKDSPAQAQHNTTTYIIPTHWSHELQTIQGHVPATCHSRSQQKA